MENFDTEKKLNNLIEIERFSLYLLEHNNNIKKTEDRKNKLKDLLNALRDGNVQKDLNFDHFFQTNVFLNLSRKDSVSLVENEIGEITKRLLNDKKNIEILKSKFVNKLVELDDLNDVDPEVIIIIEKDYIKMKTKQLQAKEGIILDEEDEDDDE